MANLGTSITDAIVSHILWRTRFISALESGFEIPKLEIVNATNQCALGKWLDAVEIPSEVRASPEFNNVVETHRNFHHVAGLVLSLLKDGRRQQFRDELEADGMFGLASSVLVDALMALRNRVTERASSG